MFKGQILKRASARFRFFHWPFENLEKFDSFWSITPDYEYRQIGNIARLGISPDWEVRQIEDSPTNGQIGAWARLDPNCQIAVRQIGARLGKRPDCQIASARLPPDCLRLPRWVVDRDQARKPKPTRPHESWAIVAGICMCYVTMNFLLMVDNQVMSSRSIKTFTEAVASSMTMEKAAWVTQAKCKLKPWTLEVWPGQAPTILFSSKVLHYRTNCFGNYFLFM